MSLPKASLSLLKTLTRYFTATNPEGKTQTYLTVQDLEGRPVTILAADEQRHYEDQAKEVAKRRAREDEERARKAAENTVAGTIRKDN